MLCQNCGKKEATMYFRQNINGQTKELNLCPDCAKELGAQDQFAHSFQSAFAKPFGSWFDDDPFFSQSFPSLFGAPFSQAAQLGSGRRCPTCGMTESELQHTGRAGCAECYNIFDDILTPYIRKLQGATAHVGTAPRPQNDTQPVENPTAALKTKLEQAIKQENYEEAARLRDEIRRLEGEQHA